MKVYSQETRSVPKGEAEDSDTESQSILVTERLSVVYGSGIGMDSWDVDSDITELLKRERKDMERLPNIKTTVTAGSFIGVSLISLFLYKIR